MVDDPAPLIERLFAQLGFLGIRSAKTGKSSSLARLLISPFENRRFLQERPLDWTDTFHEIVERACLGQLG